MNENQLRITKPDIIGRSLVLNSVGIILNLIAVVLIVIGYHESTETYGFQLKLAGFTLLGVSLLSLFVLKGLFLLSFVARVIVGGLFIVSGLIKANDPWGFAFKLEDYFAPNGLTFDYPFFENFEPYTLELSVFICVVEIILGAAVIFGGKIKLASWSLIILMAFFTWLTYYTVSCQMTQELAMAEGTEFLRQCVTDCGCFGDALKGSVGRSLTPVESFWKDLVLFYLCIIIFINQWKIKLNTVKMNWIMIPASLVVVAFFSWVFGWVLPIFFTIVLLLGALLISNLNIGKIGRPWKMAIYVSIISLLFSLYTANYLPIKDYRPYAIGNNLVEQMNNGVDQVAEYVMLYENLETHKIDSVKTSAWDNKYSDTTKYAYVSNYVDIIVPGVPNSIQDFAARIDYTQLTEAEKKIPVIDSLISLEYDNYYEEKMVLYSAEYGYDTISVIDYDTLYYPDSLYTNKGVFKALVDPSMPYSIDLTQYILTADNIFLMTIRDLETVNKSSIPDFKKILEGCREKGIPFYVLCPGSGEEVEAFKKEHGFDATFLVFDGIEIKIIIRSNPGLVLLQKATVIDKWPSRSIEDFDDIYNEYINTKPN